MGALLSQGAEVHRRYFGILGGGGGVEEARGKSSKSLMSLISLIADFLSFAVNFEFE